MPTENPKISAYVPQVVYDRFKEFQKERDLSMSQAAIEIFAHYFEINLEVSTKEFTGGLPGRLMEVERSLIELKEFCNQLASKVEHIQTTSKLLDEDTIENLDAQAITTSELPSEPKNDIPLGINESEEKGELLSNPLGKALNEEYSEPHSQLSLIDSPSDSLSSSLKEFSLPETKLAERLSMNRNTLGSRRRKGSVEDFANMTSQSDADSIKWTYSEQLKSYVPYEELSEEQSARLKIWKQQSSTK